MYFDAELMMKVCKKKSRIICNMINNVFIGLSISLLAFTRIYQTLPSLILLCPPPSPLHEYVLITKPFVITVQRKDFKINSYF